MIKTLMTHALALGGAAVMVGGLLVAAAPEAEPRAEGRGDNIHEAINTGVGNDRTGTTMNNEGMRARPGVAYIMPNTDIEPAAGPMGAEKVGTSLSSHNNYDRVDGTRGDNIHQK